MEYQQPYYEEINNDNDDDDQHEIGLKFCEIDPQFLAVSSTIAIPNTIFDVTLHFLRDSNLVCILGTEPDQATGGYKGVCLGSSE